MRAQNLTHLVEAVEPILVGSFMQGFAQQPAKERMTILSALSDFIVRNPLALAPLGILVVSTLAVVFKIDPDPDVRRCAVEAINRIGSALADAKKQRRERIESN